ncbi:four helix bundle protein [candidate division KSB1 bacterium]
MIEPKESTIISYKDLTVWKKGIDLVKEVYSLTGQFPKDESFGLTSQMRRSSVSIPSNIAEGKMRGTQKDYRHFLLHSFGSGAELETQIEITKQLPFGKKLDYNKVDSLLEEVMKMLNTLIRKLK